MNTYHLFTYIFIAATAFILAHLIGIDITVFGLWVTEYIVPWGILIMLFLIYIKLNRKDKGE